LPLTAVFETNILFSATGWQGKPFECVQRARAGEVQVVTCPELIDELAEKLESRLHFSADQVAQTLAAFCPNLGRNAGFQPALEPRRVGALRPN
jgi:hypothetical protein